MKNLTPAMRQYVEIKEQYQDCIIFFRMGDFYEMFFDDAEVASKILEITLTSRNKTKDNSIPLCGVPYHAAAAYIAKLVDHGFKVAICEQVEDPKEAKGIVKRDVVRVVTPGLVMDSDNLTAKENNLLAALALDGNRLGLAFVDISTGEFWVTESDDREFLLNEIAGLDFREIVISEGVSDKSLLKFFAREMRDCRINTCPPAYFDGDDALTVLSEFFSSDVLEKNDFAGHNAMTSAAGAVLRYVQETQKDKIHHINTIRHHTAGSYLVLDTNAKRNLELFTTIQDNRKHGSLINVLDQTATAMGGRKLRWWLNYPLIDVDDIRRRLAAVAEIKDRHLIRRDLQELLSHVYDLERLGSRISMGLANGRDLIALKESLKAVPGVREATAHMEAPLLVDITKGLDELPHIADLIERAIVEEPPVTIREGHIIREGYDAEIDELISASRDGKQWIAELEARERQKTGINTLKVGFNNVFGYYIEVTKTNTHLVPEEYIRKQTLVNAERYINEELKKYEYKVLNAEDTRKDREYAIFVDIREGVAGEIGAIQKTASFLADLDALVSLAEVAERYNYCCPIVSDDDAIEIEGGRHPVVERMDLRDGFVPNDVLLDCGSNRFLIITGPNMAGKSTYIRQVALIVLMAQMGSFVPAAKARIGVADKIFTRVGAADSLARGQSTFMVEMTEVAAILTNATSRSLILLDEVGRGTSTYDGLSIAWAVAEYIHDDAVLGARALFATHYHELTDMTRAREGVKNYSVAVKEWGDQVLFLRNIVPGGTNRSYGIQVARLAGVPDDVISRAKEILSNLEKGDLDEVGMPKIAEGRDPDAGNETAQLSLFMDDADYILHDLKNMDIATLTPLEALNTLNDWQKKLKR